MNLPFRIFIIASCVGMAACAEATPTNEHDLPAMYYADTGHGTPFAKDPSVVRFKGRCLMYYSLRIAKRIGKVRSRNLLDWHEVQYLKFPEVVWADNGPTAPMVIGQQDTLGVWLMVFHGERRRISPHGAALGLAWSRNLHDWTLP